MKAVGARLPRYDGLAQVTGRNTYVDDVRVPGTLWAKALRSPHHFAGILTPFARVLGEAGACDPFERRREIRPQFEQRP